jgi:adenosylcobinamide-phosphate synthase
MSDFIQNLHSYLLDPARFPIAIAALVIVTVLGMLRGGLGGMATPFYWHLVDIAFGKMGQRMDKSGRPKGDLIFRGFILSAVVLTLSFIISRFFEIMAFYYPFWSLIEVFSLCIVLTSGAVWAGMGNLYRALHDQKVTTGAYYTIARTTRTDLTRSDDFTITRVGMGMGLRAFDKGVVGPLIWFLILGLPGAFFYAGLSALGWRFGRDGYSNGLGSAPLALEKLMGFVPNLFSGFLIACAGLLTPTAGMTRAFKGFFVKKGRASYEEGGYPVTIAAHSLDVTLGGATTDLDGKTINRSWVGPEKATAQLDSRHLHRVTYICFMAHLLFLLSLLAAWLYSEQFWAQ